MPHKTDLVSAICWACGNEFRRRRDRIGYVPFCSLTCNRSAAGTRSRFHYWVIMNDSGCWGWAGRKQPDGYSKFRDNNRSSLAHRYSYEHFRGPIPDGLVIDHLCRNRSCSNPAHLEAVTMRENLLRGEGIFAKNARKTHCKRGHALTGDNVYRTHLGHRGCRACTRIYDNGEGPKLRRKLHKQKIRSYQRNNQVPA